MYESLLVAFEEMKGMKRAHKRKSSRCKTGFIHCNRVSPAEQKALLAHLWSVRKYTQVQEVIQLKYKNDNDECMQKSNQRTKIG